MRIKNICIEIRLSLNLKIIKVRFDLASVNNGFTRNVVAAKNKMMIAKCK